MAALQPVLGADLLSCNIKHALAEWAWLPADEVCSEGRFVTKLCSEWLSCSLFSIRSATTTAPILFHCVLCGDG